MINSQILEKLNNKVILTPKGKQIWLNFNQEQYNLKE